MVGCVLGILGGVLILKMARRRWMYAHGYGGHCGGGGWHRRWHGHHHGWHRGGGWRQGGDGIAMLAWELRLTEDQEEAVRQAVREVRAAARDARPELQRTREDLARAFRADSFDAELLGATFARHDEELERLRKAVVGALAKAHTQLDERQRGRLADWLGSWRGGMGFGPYR